MTSERPREIVWEGLLKSEPERIKSYKCVYKDKDGNPIEEKTFFGYNKKDAIWHAKEYARWFVQGAAKMSISEKEGL